MIASINNNKSISLKYEARTMQQFDLYLVVKRGLIFFILSRRFYIFERFFGNFFTKSSSYLRNPFFKTKETVLWQVWIFDVFATFSFTPFSISRTWVNFVYLFALSCNLFFVLSRRDFPSLKCFLAILFSPSFLNLQRPLFTKFELLTKPLAITSFLYHFFLNHPTWGNFVYFFAL